MISPFAKKPQIPTQQVSLGGRMIDLLRLDQIHHEISGNKWFKLKYNIEKAISEGTNRILTFGGAFSNHIAAVAAAGKLSGVSTIGVIRGEEHPTNETLQRAIAQGMKIIHVSRETYKNRNDPTYLQELDSRFGPITLVPEGGSNVEGVLGASEIPSFFEKQYSLISMPVGTGGTMAGVISTSSVQQILGFTCLRGAEYLRSEIEQFLPSDANKGWKLIHDFHFGGYAKIDSKLVHFIRSFYVENGVKLDPIYTGKMMYGLKSQIEKGHIDPSEEILAIHTGGLQGIAGMEKRYGLRFFET